MRHRHLVTLGQRRDDLIGWWLTDDTGLSDVTIMQDYQIEHGEPYGELTVKARDVRVDDRLGWVKGVKITDVRGQRIDVPSFVTEDGGQHYYQGYALVQINRPFKPADPDVTITLQRSVVTYMAEHYGGFLTHRQQEDSSAWAQIFRACRDAL